MARTKLKDYLNAKKFEHGHDPEDVAQLNEFEQKIVHKHLLMTIHGKRGRKVSVLIKLINSIKITKLNITHSKSDNK